MNRAINAKARPLRYLMGWFVRLRWVAGAVVLVGAAVEWRWLGWYSHPGAMAVVGGVIIAYNAALWMLMRRIRVERAARPMLLGLAWAQLLLDMGCLTLLALLTGAASSPLLGFFVFHMVFASLLLPREMAYAGASLAMLMMAVGCWFGGQWPETRGDITVMLGWALTLLMTVWLANGITRSLRHQRRRLMRQNRRIREMSLTLRSQQQGMIQQEKMAASGRMAAGVAHEIANPLASMDGLLQLMERRPEKVRPDAVATLREQVARISQIVRRMMEFAHPGEGQWQSASVNDLLDKMIEVLRFDPRLKRVQIVRDYQRDLSPVHVLSEALEQVIVNLVINALDAMEQTPQPRLALRTRRNADSCDIEIQDNGHGIGPEQLKRIFEPFFTTKPVGKGTGLGLSISYSLVRKLGGSIFVESRPGEGARFVVKLPVAGAAFLPKAGNAVGEACNS